MSWILPLVLLTAVIALFLRRRYPSFWAEKKESGYLCDRCLSNDERYCSLPVRPRATVCEDFTSRQR